MAAHFVILAQISGVVVTYLYADSAKAWRKVQTLQRAGKLQRISREGEGEIAPAELERRANLRRD